jgi:PAS domain-containing protein
LVVRTGQPSAYLIRHKLHHDTSAVTALPPRRHHLVGRNLPHSRPASARECFIIVRDEHGRPRRAFGTAPDITERKLAEEKLRETTEQLRALSASLQSAGEGEKTCPQSLGLLGDA